MPDSEIQVRGRLEYRQMSPNAKEKYVNAAAAINAVLPEPTGISKDTMIRRIVKNIETNVSIITYCRSPRRLSTGAHPVHLSHAIVILGYVIKLNNESVAVIVI